MLRLLTCLILAVAAWLLSAPSTSAQDYPSRPVKLIIPLGPGGAGDVFTRLLAEELQKRLGQPFVVENRPGGGLNIGSRACAEAANVSVARAARASVFFMAGSLQVGRIGRWMQRSSPPLSRPT